MFEGAQGSLLDIDHGTYPYVTSQQHHHRRRAGRHRCRRRRDRLRAGHRQGLRHPRRRRPVPDRTQRRGRRGHPQARRRVRRHHRPPAPLRLDRHRRAQARGGDQRHHRPVHHQARRARRHAHAEDVHRLRVPRQAAPSTRRWTPPAGTSASRCTWSSRAGARTTAGITEFAKLPPAARAYLRALEELVGCPLAIVSTGPDRDATMILRDPFA